MALPKDHDCNPRGPGRQKRSTGSAGHHHSTLGADDPGIIAVAVLLQETVGQLHDIAANIPAAVAALTPCGNACLVAGGTADRDGDIGTCHRARVIPQHDRNKTVNQPMPARGTRHFKRNSGLFRASWIIAHAAGFGCDLRQTCKSGPKGLCHLHVVLASLFDEALSVLSDAFAPDAAEILLPSMIVLFPRPALHPHCRNPMTKGFFT